MDNTEEAVPQHLYKYKAFPKTLTEWKRLVELIRDTKIYFASPEDLNDPYDCKVYFNFKKGSQSDTENYWCTFFLKEMKMNYMQAYCESKRLSCWIHKDSDSSKIINDILDKYFNEFYGVFSLTKDNLSLPMWAYYGSNHTGLCLEYDAKELQRAGNDYIFKGNIVLLSEVNYVEKYPKISPTEIDPTNISFYKYDGWKLEKEWRFCTYFPQNKTISCSDRNYKFQNNILTGIYFGVNATKKHINFVKRIIENNNPQPILYKMELKPFSFEFNPPRIL